MFKTLFRMFRIFLEKPSELFEQGFFDFQTVFCRKLHSGCACDVRSNITDNSGQIRIRFHQFFYLSDRAERSSMVSAELSANVIEREICQLSHFIHGDLPCHGSVFGTIVSFEVFRFQRIIFCSFTYDVIRFWNVRTGRAGRCAR